MRKIISILSLLLIFSSVTFAQSFQNIQFFGDSLTDNGNLYRLSFGFIPQSPPYFKGRFSNGPTWAENFGDSYLQNFKITSKNDAVGGATVIARDSELPIVIPCLSEQVDEYLLSHLLDDKSKTLFVIWMGANDYLNGFSNVDQITTNVTNELAAVVTKLIKEDAKHFLIINLPDLSKTPLGASHPEYQIGLQAATVLNNSKLFLAIDNLKSSYPTIDFKYIDIFSTFNDLLINIQNYNEKYQTNIKNTTDACLVTDNRSRANLNVLNAELTKTTKHEKNINAQQINAFAQMILRSPDLLTAYSAGKAYPNDTKICNNPDAFLFWDDIHPSAVTHVLISKIILEQLG